MYSGVARFRAYAVIVAAFNATISLLALPNSADYEFVSGIALVSVGCFATICLVESGNLLFLARTFILGLLGYFPMLVKMHLGEQALFDGFYEPSTQGFDVVVRMYAATSIALLGNAIGLALATSQCKSSMGAVGYAKTLTASVLREERQFWRVAGFFGFGMVVVSAYYFVRGYGGTVFETGYGGDGEGLPFGSVGVLGSVGILAILVGGLKGYIPGWKAWLVLAVFLFVWHSQLLRGLRQDALSTIFGLVVLYGVATRRGVGLSLKYVPVVILLIAMAEVWGTARAFLAEGIPVLEILERARAGIDAGGVVRFGTVSAITTTFSSTVWLVDNGLVEYAWGRTYLEWLLRIPPEFLFPDRPKDYSSMFEEFGLLSGGGFFELAEAYMNFGLAGALIVPCAISFVMARVYFHALHMQSPWSYFLLFSFLGVFLRGTWYQSFAFFRAALVCAVLYLIYMAVLRTFRLACAGIRVSTRAHGSPEGVQGYA